MKRLMCLLLALVMVFSLLGVSAFAEETTETEETEETDVQETEDDAEGEDAEEADESEEADDNNGISTTALDEDEDEDDDTVPITVTGATDGLYSSFDYTEVEFGSWYGVYLKAGYDIEVTGATPDLDFYDIDSDGTVYRYCDFIVDDDAESVVVTVVASDDVAPTAVKITTVLPEGLEDDGWPSGYILSTNSDFISLPKGYGVTITGGELLLSNTGVTYTNYYIYPDAGATEITLTITKLDGGTLAVSGESSQLVSITDAEGNTVEAGDFVESDAVLYVTVNQGYVVTDGTRYDCDSETGAMIYRIAASDILADGAVTVNIEQGVVVAIVNGDDGYRYGYASDGVTYAVGDSLYVYTNNGYIAEFSGADVNVTDTEYYCSSSSGEVYAYYRFTGESAGTLTVTFREAEDGELPTPIQVEYVDEYDALDYGYTYVLPGQYFYVSLDGQYTVEVTGATVESVYAGERRSDWNGYVDDDATAVTVTVVPIVDNAELVVVDESGADASDAVVQVEDVDSLAAGDTLTVGTNYLCLENGYEIAAVDGAVWYEVGYSMDDSGAIYVQYVLVPTGDPAEVTVTVVEKAVVTTVTIVNNGVYAWVGNYEEKASNTEYTMLSKNELYVEVPAGYTIRVTGGTVDTELSYAGSSYSWFYVQPTGEAMTVEIISLEEMAEILGVDVSELGDTIALDSTNDPDQQAKPDDKPDDQPDSKPDAKPDGEKAPDTGDETNVTLWAALVAVFAASAGAVLTVLKKKEN